MPIKKYVSYPLLVNLLGLSQHPHQVKRRIAKYPNHFAEVNGKLHVSLAYAKFIIESQLIAEESFVLQQGGLRHEE